MLLNNKKKKDLVRIRVKTIFYGSIFTNSLFCFVFFIVKVDGCTDPQISILSAE